MSTGSRSWLPWAALAVVGLLLTAPAFGVGVVGIPYFLTAEAVRTDHWLHPWYGPGKRVGLLMGFLGTLLLLAMLLYSLRKWLGPPILGGIEWWLRAHVVFGLLAPVYIVLHAGFVWPSGFVAIGFWCMILVVISGMFGMWVFPLIPRAMHAAREAQKGEKAVLDGLHRKLGNGAHDPPVRQSFTVVRSFRGRSGTPWGLLLTDLDLAKRKALVRHHLASSALPAHDRAYAGRVLVRQLALRRRATLLELVQRVTSPWPILHFPLALAMYVVIFFHILLALVFGDVLGSLW